MPRKGRSKLLKTRRRRPGKTFSTKITLDKGDSKSKGRTLSVRKVSYEELYKVGEFDPLPNKLMREFRQVDNDKRRSQEWQREVVQSARSSQVYPVLQEAQ